MEEIKIIKKDDKNYPASLKKIPDAPKALYYRGNFIANEACVGIVGTRRPSPYGQQATISIAKGLVDSNITIVSGMAPGIDTFAHRTCVENGKRTVAVLGSGLDEESIYPQSNMQLSRDIIKHGGCLISELPPGTKGSKFTFPRRNRIISALSLGILVIEAKEKSGSLITANYAKQHKKKLFAMPGPIFSLNSKGPNGLIKNGATLVESANDILEALHLAPIKEQKDLLAGNNEEQVILNILKEEAMYIDNIIEKTKLQASLVATTLALLEISGKIRNLGGNVYSLN
ncbi:MAG: DNA protecting protein DprA [Candidatus Staskawiczbacteria bacterium RIFCSPLOWO2_01_FULL_40_39]|uniref:DNA protecting protein DprA n=1 Tax=Candidatus Staskawiczbacteria bacterium RIFCSPHIGHO2_01_FULL_39_25 TaxID=1802202 RepID=A0A1G2HNN4_9BACT|nr:MAG: DNA protecting protein DprA [Candidatus Staskawiczbacteria bacterium RIFCSPHIGHO2_01_FULL_39_25]OGZ73923.1 MAG: DNA protecting protein DprA [Candidatus Staskawiczbacteria bacterium RIFCSPLOWO2_01_FULL_40_39]OGZ76542.1 MAG: DNA protecting protein DprA [Candidatus Staskawiczbacteria bacterium RIFCSPLOWO2_02_FULL_39_8]